MGRKAIDGSDSGFYSQEHKKYVKKQMQLEGLSLEIQVYEMLKKKGWEAELGDHYWEIDRALSLTDRVKQYLQDIHSSTILYREVDVVAERFVTPINVDLFTHAKVKLVIECKARLGENWVIYMEERGLDPTTISNMGSFVRNDLSARRYLQSFYQDKFQISDKVREILQGTSHHRLEESLVMGRKGQSLFKNNKSFYNALCQVISASDFNNVAECSMTEMDIYSFKKNTIPRFNSWSIYPVIVFDGPLWKVSLDNPDPQPLEYAKFDIMMHNRGYTVDVVRWDCFEKYLDTLEKEIKALKRLV